MLRTLVWTAALFLAVLANSTSSYACERTKFNGFYAGLSAGYGFGDYEAKYHGFTYNEIEGSGATAGAYAGYNYQCGKLLYGIEGDGFWSGISDDVTYDTGTIELETSYLASIRARLGYDIGAAMLFATAGVGFTEVESTDISTDTGRSSLSDNATGFVFGGGIETMVSSMFSARFEVLHYRFGEVLSASDDMGGKVTIDHNPTVIRVGGAIHFNN